MSKLPPILSIIAPPKITPNVGAVAETTIKRKRTAAASARNIDSKYAVPLTAKI